jgi:hypothetical protein
MKQRLLTVLLAALLLLSCSYLVADWLDGPGIPLDPAAIKEAGFTTLQQVRKTSGEDVGGAGSAIVFEAEAESEADARILQVQAGEPCVHDHPAPPATREIPVPGPERIIIERAIIELTASSLGGKCRQEVLERDGNWWAQAYWTGWVDIERNQRIQRGPIPANNVMVAEVAKPYSPKSWSFTLLGGFQTGASEPGWYVGGVYRFRKHLGLNAYFARDFGARIDGYSSPQYARSGGCPPPAPPAIVDLANQHRIGVGISWTF